MATKVKKLSPVSRALLILGGILLIVSLFVPIWRIDLVAPQYPEGLFLTISADGLGGNVEIINGLNHYIGMAELNSEDFVEFKILPYLIGIFAALCLLIALWGRKSGLYALLTLFALFGIVAMVDFYRWEYDYGHNLNPNAAIIVPGQAYQPPLIGFKQLLNFGAYSFPALGGYLFVVTGVLMVIGIFIEGRKNKLARSGSVVTAMMVFLIGLSACSERGPEAIALNSDNCDYCRMGIADGRFAAELVTKKGRVYKFDDVSCLAGYVQDNQPEDGSREYVCDFDRPGTLISASGAFFVTHESFASPMGGNSAAFNSRETADEHARRTGSAVLSWTEVKAAQ